MTKFRSSRTLTQVCF